MKMIMNRTLTIVMLLCSQWCCCTPACTPLDQASTRTKYLNHITQQYGHDLPFLQVIEPLIALAEMYGIMSAESSCDQNAQCRSPEPVNNVYVDQDTCPSQPETDPSALQQQTAFCPWYYVITNVTNRYPQVLTEARCCQNVCLVSGVTSCECDTITRVVPVITRTDVADAQGNCVYDYELFSLPVACTASASYIPQE